MNQEEKNKFEVGDKVYTKLKPKVEMIVRKYYAGIYYCYYAVEPDKKELALFERELV
ncbi:hypothetical protein AAGF08_19730 [Algoriphagus sp. SE2]|uniref:hypothetical protein n=1 Tax=Algoriphagus sp. SE2 TaxID=3141536 RepID=UPI0031CD29AC